MCLAIKELFHIYWLVCFFISSFIFFCQIMSDDTVAHQNKSLLYAHGSTTIAYTFDQKRRLIVKTHKGALLVSLEHMLNKNLIYCRKHNFYEWKLCVDLCQRTITYKRAAHTCIYYIVWYKKNSHEIENLCKLVSLGVVYVNFFLSRFASFSFLSTINHNDQCYSIHHTVHQAVSLSALTMSLLFLFQFCIKPARHTQCSISIAIKCVHQREIITIVYYFISMQLNTWNFSSTTNNI